MQQNAHNNPRKHQDDASRPDRNAEEYQQKGSHNGQDQWSKTHDAPGRPENQKQEIGQTSRHGG
jgi:hypothetical protein